MSLVTGLLNKICDIYRPTLTDDGAGGETWSLPSIPTFTGIEILLTNKTSMVLTPTGGRQLVERWSAFLEESDGSQLGVNDVIRNVIDKVTGSVASQVVDGQSVSMAWKVKSLVNPNFLVDGTGHAEFELEIVAGRVGGLP